MTISIPVQVFDDLITEIEEAVDVYDAADIVFETLMFYMHPESYHKFDRYLNNRY